GAVHAVVEDARHDHVAQAALHGLDVEVRIPRTVRLVVFAQNADQRVGDVGGVLGRDVDVGAADLAGLRHLDVAEVGLVAGAVFGLGNVQAKRRAIGLGYTIFHLSFP